MELYARHIIRAGLSIASEPPHYALVQINSDGAAPTRTMEANRAFVGTTAVWEQSPSIDWM